MDKSHGEKATFQKLRSGRSRRGVTLIATVLLSALAATIAVIIVRQTVLVTETNSQDVNSVVVKSSAVYVGGEFERNLTMDNHFYLERTFAWERPRLCMSETEQLNGKWLVPTLDISGEPVSQPWPTECGNFWTYPNASSIPQTQGFTTVGGAVTAASWDSKDWLTRAEVLLPSPSNTKLRLMVLAAGGSQESGQLVSYSRNYASKWTLFSDQSLDLSAATSGLGVGVTGSVYSGGNISADSDAGLLSAGLLAAEGQIGWPVPTIRSGVGNPTTAQEEAGFINVRDIVPTPLTLQELREGFDSTVEAVCPERGGINVISNGATRASKLCLSPSASFVDVTGNTVISPADVTAWLVVLSDPDQNPDEVSVDIYYADAPLTFTQECIVACGVNSVSSNLVNSGSDPSVSPGAFKSPWQLLATSWLPETGVIWAGQDVFVSTNSASSQTSASVSVMSGTSYAPSDVYISGELTTTGDALFGAVASGAVRFPYFIAKGGVRASVDVSAAGMGWGQDGASVTGVPSQGAGEADGLASVAINGSLAGSRIVKLEGLSDVTVTHDTRLNSGNPPHYAAFTNRWQVSSATTLTSSDVCESYLTSAQSATCVGTW